MKGVNLQHSFRAFIVGVLVNGNEMAQLGTSPILPTAAPHDINAGQPAIAPFGQSDDLRASMVGVSVPKLPRAGLEPDRGVRGK
jgi:hypothetical protein